LSYFCHGRKSKIWFDLPRLGADIVTVQQPQDWGCQEWKLDNGGSEMAILKMTAEEIKVLRKTLKMSEAELASRIELEDRQAVKLLESGGMAPTVKMQRFLIRLLRNGATRSPKLKKMFEAIKVRSEVRF
jgi:DNA-binding XRE family transcriptional regulator